MNDKMYEPLLSLDDVANWLGVRPQTIYSWRKVGLGPRAIKVGAALRFRHSDVEAWINSQTEDEAS